MLAATLLQFVGALCVRGYARCLWVKEIREEEWARAAMVDGADHAERTRRTGSERRSLEVIEEFVGCEGVDEKFV